MGDSTRRSRRPAVWVLALIRIGSVLAGPTDGPMTDEDVVRLFAAGRTPEAIVAEIERRDPEFDLSPEMLEELRNIRLPEPVIEAMRARQAARQRDDRERALAAEAASNPRLLVRLSDGDDGPTVSVGRAIDPQFAAEWELGNAPEDREFADLALFIACLTGDHVPDHWRSNSPLGRDFFSPMPRHAMLVFLSAADGEDEERPGRRIALHLPATIEVPLRSGETHDLMIGLALEVDGHYRRLRSDVWHGVEVRGSPIVLPAVVKGRNLRTLHVRFAREGDDETSDDADDDRPAPGS
jgi:hypothetical protein